MIKANLVCFLLSTATLATAFLPLKQPSRVSKDLFMSKDVSVARIPLGRKERYVRRSLEQLDEEYQALKEQLRRDLFQLKHKQREVAQEEDELLQEAIDEAEKEQLVLEREILVSKSEQRKAQKVVEEAQRRKASADENWIENQEAWMKSEHHYLKDFLELGSASAELKKSEKILKATKEEERRAQLEEEQLSDMLSFVEEQEALLKEVSLNPEKEHLWIIEELTAHHKNLLHVAGLELETTALWTQLNDDLLDLKQRQLQVGKEEELLAAKLEEIVDFQTKQQEDQIELAAARINAIRKQMRQVVSQKEQAYIDTLKAIKEADKNPHQTWKLVEPSKALKDRDNAEEAIKDEISRLAAIEKHADDLLPLLKQKSAILKELRLPGHEEALRKWVKDELSHHESVLKVVKDKLIDT